LAPLQLFRKVDQKVWLHFNFLEKLSKRFGSTFLKGGKGGKGG